MSGDSLAREEIWATVSLRAAGRKRGVMIALRFILVVMAGAGMVTDLAAEQPVRAKSAKNENVQSLFGTDWQPSLDGAKKVAGKAQPGKPILFLRVLGKLDDKL